MSGLGFSSRLAEKVAHVLKTNHTVKPKKQKQKNQNENEFQHSDENCSMFIVVVGQNQQMQRASSNAPTILFENMARKTLSMAFTFSQCAGCKQENFIVVENGNGLSLHMIISAIPNTY